MKSRNSLIAGGETNEGVEYEAVRGIRSSDALLHDLVRYLVRSVPARRDELGHGAAELRPRTDLLTEQLACRDSGEVKELGKPSRLGTFTYPRRPHQEH